MKNIMNAPFVEEMRKTTANMYRLGWDERNGGNISYMLDENEVAEYLNGDNGAFETYLREKRRIATIEDIEALSEKYGLNDADARSITVDKANLDVIDRI